MTSNFLGLTAFERFVIIFCKRLQNKIDCRKCSLVITIREIARKAKVSPSTVSRALHNPALVKTETRNKILKISQKNNYICNVQAQGLITKKSKIFGVIIPTIASSLFALSVKGIQDCAEEKGYQILFGNTDYELEKEKKLINLLMERRVDGMILHGLTIDKETLRRLKKNHFPFVVTWEIGKDSDIDMVSYDDFEGTYNALNFLYRLGHQRIAMIMGPFAAVGRAVIRWRAYRKFFRDHGIQYDPAIVLQRIHSISNGQEAMSQLLKRKPTAVLCGSDMLAVGAIRAIHEGGLKVPDDISIIGFYDSELAIFSNPPLTTIKIRAYELGRLASQVLISRIQGEIKQCQRHILKSEFVIRGSVGPAKGM